MPLIEPSSYRSPSWLTNGHLQTIYPAMFRRMPVLTTRRERIETPDGDFLDLDWNPSPSSDRLLILSHGLEGDSRNSYVQGMAAAFLRRGWDVLAWNCRGCSGEINRLKRSYHSGASEDLDTVIRHVAARYHTLGLIGFSLGGNIVLKYLGERGASVDPRIRRAVAFSSPCDLASSSLKLEEPANRLYMARFLKTLRAKLRQKMAMFPGQIPDPGMDAMRSFREFDGAFTAPLHGFTSADDYWTKSSSKPLLPHITIPTLLINARNDPFLSQECFPEEEARNSANFFLEAPESGGHLGFVSFNSQGEYWSETRAAEFVNS